MVNIDYHSDELYSRIVKVIGESIINEVLEMTIRFVTEMIKMQMNESNILVGFSHEKSDIELIFSYRYYQYTPILNAIDKANHIDDFFNSYFDEIRHEYVEGENKLIFRFTMMSDVEMKRKYLDALDKKTSREGDV
jgi:hypothetical protein